MPSAFAPGLSSFEDHPCPPGYWCPGGQGAFLCPPGTFRTEPGASSWEDCELCPPGYYCPEAEQGGRANVFPIPCRAGSECSAGETVTLRSLPAPPPALPPPPWGLARSSCRRPREHHTGIARPPACLRKPSTQPHKVHPVWLGLCHLDLPRAKVAQPVPVSLRCCG